MGGLLHPELLSHSCCLSPSGVDVAGDIFLRAAPRGMLVKRALKKVFSAPFLFIGMYFISSIFFSSPPLEFPKSNFVRILECKFYWFVLKIAFFMGLQD